MPKITPLVVIGVMAQIQPFLGMVAELNKNGYNPVSNRENGIR